MKSGVVSSSSPRALRCAFSAVRRNVIVPTPGISTGYWKARNTPATARCVRLHLQEILAVVEHLAVGDLVLLLAGEHVGERRFAGAVRPHDGVHLAGVHGEVDAVQDFLAVDFDVQVLDFKHSEILPSPL